MTRGPGDWLTSDMRSAIKLVLEHEHGVTPSDNDINWVSAAEESTALTQYQSRIIRKLELLPVRRSQTTAHDHRASELLMEANACYRDGRFDACILVSRAAVEAALQTAVGKRIGLHRLIDLAIAERLLDDGTGEMAHALREIGNDFAHCDVHGILDREQAQVAEVIFVGEQPSESERPALEASTRVGMAASRLALKAYRSAVRICEKLVPTDPRPPERLE